MDTNDKHIRVFCRRVTHKRLKVLVATGDFKTFDDALVALLDYYERGNKHLSNAGNHLEE